MTKKEQKEFAKELLIEALSVAYYRLENYNNITEDEAIEICKYMQQYGEAMAKRINREYYTV